MKKITIKISDEISAEFNAAVKRRCTTQKKAFEVMLADWLSPQGCGGCVRMSDAVPELRPNVMGRLLGYWSRG